MKLGGELLQGTYVSADVGHRLFVLALPFVLLVLGEDLRHFLTAVKDVPQKIPPGHYAASRSN
jgi:hypothetical protein